MYSNHPLTTPFSVKDILSWSEQQGALDYPGAALGYMQGTPYPYDMSPSYQHRSGAPTPSYEQLSALPSNPACLYGSATPTYTNLSYQSHHAHPHSSAGTLVGGGGVMIKPSDYEVMSGLSGIKPDYETQVTADSMSLPVKQEYESHVTEMAGHMTHMGDQVCMEEDCDNKGNNITKSNYLDQVQATY
ncbi:hypothetical protein ElyMa_001459900 [Elysia marginata]|uniref:Uncharacterized protein n=1 Tax=Elysia marginata TaxID=1093978 RepID=A0AAV4J0X8_9GAST|nr:hypothetical protein ElyMa_001459900 [Elysia marginata]